MRTTKSGETKSHLNLLEFLFLDTHARLGPFALNSEGLTLRHGRTGFHLTEGLLKRRQSILRNISRYHDHHVLWNVVSVAVRQDIVTLHVDHRFWSTGDVTAKGVGVENSTLE